MAFVWREPVDLGTLNPAQRAAVEAPDGAMLVVAGAGTGKTRTLVHRVAWLIERGVPPSGIVLLTFTRRAASEMLERATGLVGARARQVRGGTFHGFANQLLRRFASVVGYTSRFTLIDRADAGATVGLVRAELGIGGRGVRFPQKSTVVDLISKAVNTGRPLADLAKEEVPQYGPIGPDLERIAEGFALRKKKADQMDYDDLLTRSLELLSVHEGPRARVSQECVHVLVDEYQDTNHIQAQIACMLASYHGSLVVVGDEAQSIYAFRGARVRNILDFPQLFEGCRTVVIEENYRSVQPILDLANAILATAKEGFEKNLRSTIRGGEPPVLWSLSEDGEEPGVVIREIAALRARGVTLREIAVLVRSGWHANLLEVALNQNHVPFRKFGGQRFNEAAHVKDLVALLRVVVNPKDDAAWVRCLSWLDGVGEKTAQTLAAQAAEGRLDVTVTRKRYADELRSLMSCVEAARAEVAPLAALDVALGWYRGVLDRLYEDPGRREKDLGTLRVLAESATTLDGLLADLALDPIGDDEAQDDEEEWLTISTVHSAKGLEWDAVFVLGLADGSFPSGYAFDDVEAMEEERRLFYVAVTRARRHLHLLRPSYARAAAARGFGPSCALVDDLPGLRSLVQRGRVARVAPAADPKLADAEARMARFLEYFGKKH